MSLSEIFGRKLIFLVVLTLFTIGAILCAVAQRIPLMLVGRSIQGLGAGGIITLTDVLITDMVPLRYRGKYIALIGIVWSIGSVSGPILGGVFAEKSYVLGLILLILF